MPFVKLINALFHTDFEQISRGKMATIGIN